MGANKIGVPQRSVLGLLLYNVFVNDISWFANHIKICNYADDTTVFVYHSELGIVIWQLQDDCSVIIKWFSDNLVKLNDEKCHLMVFGDKKRTIVKIENSESKESECEKLLGISFDKKLNFKKHIEDFCRKANQKIHAFARLSNYIDPVKSEILMNSFSSSQFNYCPLVWMFNERATNAKLNRTFEKALRLVCKCSESKLETLKEKYVVIHQHNLQLLLVEIFKTENNLSPTIICKTYLLREISHII